MENLNKQDGVFISFDTETIVGTAGAATKRFSEILPSELSERGSVSIVDNEESPVSEHILSKFSVGIVGSGSLTLTSAVAEVIAKQMGVDALSDLGYAHISIDGQEVVFVDKVELLTSEEMSIPNSIIVGSDRHLLELLNSVDMIKEMKLEEPFFEREKFPLDFTRPIVRNQVIMNKPKHLIKKIIH